MSIAKKKVPDYPEEDLQHEKQQFKERIKNPMGSPGLIDEESKDSTPTKKLNNIV